MNSVISPKTDWVNISAKNLIGRFQQVRNTSVELCKPLQLEDYVVQPVDFVSPPKWNLAHVSWFFETFVLKPYFTHYQEFNPEFGYFFNSYYESVGQRTLRAQRGNMTRPTTEEVYAYRKYVDEAMLSFLAQNPELPKTIYQIIDLGLHHEQQHQELLLTDLKYILGHNPLFPKYKIDLNSNSASNSKLDFLSIQAGVYEIGYQGSDFCFDNELGLHKVYLHPFKIANRLITNAEYLEFMEAGAYQKFQYWLGAGWDWVRQNQVKSPLYWHLIDNQWFNYTLSGLQKVNLDEPVTHISFFEADAFARWAGKRLPTEFEWEIACQQLEPSIPQMANLLEMNSLQPIPALKINYQFYGDCWEWTNSAYLPYPYYKQAEGALGEYNGKFMINQMVLRGGSCVTPISHIRPTYRNFFHTHERWQFTGIRLAEHL
jgi:ergothioneine biosynthesis protein EgtB